MTDDMQRARESFEKWHCEKFKTQWLTGAPTRDMHNGVYDDNYGPPAQQERWELWQAAYAAALRSAPEGFVPERAMLSLATSWRQEAAAGGRNRAGLIRCAESLESAVIAARLQGASDAEVSHG